MASLARGARSAAIPSTSLTASLAVTIELVAATSASVAKRSSGVRAPNARLSNATNCCCDWRAAPARRGRRRRPRPGTVARRPARRPARPGRRRSASFSPSAPSRRARRFPRFRDPGEKDLDGVLERAHEAVLLGGELLVEGLARDPRRAQHVCDRRSHVPLLRHRLGERPQDPLALGAHHLLAREAVPPARQRWDSVSAAATSIVPVSGVASRGRRLRRGQLHLFPPRDVQRAPQSAAGLELDQALRDHADRKHGAAPSLGRRCAASVGGCLAPGRRSPAPPARPAAAHGRRAASARPPSWRIRARSCRCPARRSRQRRPARPTVAARCAASLRATPPPPSTRSRRTSAAGAPPRPGTRSAGSSRPGWLTCGPAARTRL